MTSAASRSCVLVDPDPVVEAGISQAVLGASRWSTNPSSRWQYQEHVNSLKFGPSRPSYLLGFVESRVCGLPFAAFVGLAGGSGCSEQGSQLFARTAASFSGPVFFSSRLWPPACSPGGRRRLIILLTARRVSLTDFFCNASASS